MNCKNCGTPIQPGSNICGVCGVKVEETPQVTQNTVVVPVVNPNMPDGLAAQQPQVVQTAQPQVVTVQTGQPQVVAQPQVVQTAQPQVVQTGQPVTQAVPQPQVVAQPQVVPQPQAVVAEPEVSIAAPSLEAVTLDKEEPKKKTNKGLIIIILILIVIILGGIAAFLMYDMKKPNSTPTPIVEEPTTTTSESKTNKLTNEKVIETNDYYKHYEIDLGKEDGDKVEYDLNNIKLVFNKSTNLLYINTDKEVKITGSVFNIYYLNASNGIFFEDSHLYYYDKTVGLVDVTKELITKDSIQEITKIEFSVDDGNLYIDGTRLSGDILNYGEGSFNVCKDTYTDYIESNLIVNIKYAYKLKTTLYDKSVFETVKTQDFGSVNPYDSDHCQVVRSEGNNE